MKPSYKHSFLKTWRRADVDRPTATLPANEIALSANERSQGRSPRLGWGHDGAVKSTVPNVTAAAVRLLHISAIVCLFKDKQPIDSGILFIRTLCVGNTIRHDVTRWRKRENTEEYSYGNSGATGISPTASRALQDLIRHEEISISACVHGTNCYNENF